jgi:hypothetical protein
MKKHIILRVAVLIFLSCISCSEDKNTDENTAENFSNEPCSGNKGTCCSIIGRFKVLPGKKYTYTVSSSISNPTVVWHIDSGAITFVSSQGLSAVFKFEPGFTTGRIHSRATDPIGSDLCETILDISKE